MNENIDQNNPLSQGNSNKQNQRLLDRDVISVLSELSDFLSKKTESGEKGERVKTDSIKLKIDPIAFKNPKIAESIDGMVAVKNGKPIGEDEAEIKHSIFEIPIKLVETCELKLPNRIELYSGLDITEKDNVYVKNFNPQRFSCTGMSSSRDFKFDSNVMLVNCDSYNKDNVVVGFFSLMSTLKDGTAKYFLVASADNISFNDIKYSNNYFVFPRNKNNKTEYVKAAVEVDFRDTETTGTHLCIDFGTSNTTAGAFLDSHYVEKISNLAKINGQINPDSENLVSFNTFSDQNLSFSELSPTVLYVKQVKNHNDPDSVVFAFGYEAMKLINNDGYCPKASCFMEIKRWITDIDRIEEIHDPEGNKIKICRRDVVARYFSFIIREAENQFKCKFERIHMSTPVKLKKQTLELYDSILNSIGYKLEKEHAIDEAISVLYSIIDRDIKEKKYEKLNDLGKKEWVRKVLIIDCGGGTSDLASCEYKIEKDPDGVVDYNVSTEYVNGDINFGGNNITYRIMQFMKIVYAGEFCHKGRITIDSLISPDSESIFSYMENTEDGETFSQKYKNIYSKLEEEYIKADAVIPTMFIKYENSTSEEYNRIKNNFYFLWKLAEGMKKEFYRTNSISRYTFTDEKNKDVDLCVYNDRFWKLYHCSSYDQSTPFFEDKKFPKVTFNAKEIDKLIRADIYNLVRKFLNDLYEDKNEKTNLQSYDQIKLSGQTSKINIFMDCLKEFLPGRKIGRSNSKERGAVELKLMCIKGAIMYIHSLENSSIEGKLKNKTNNIPISVYTLNPEGLERRLIEQGTQWDQPSQKNRITKGAKQITFIMRSSDMQCGKTYKFDCENIKWQETSFNDIEKISNRLISQTEDLDHLPEDKKYAFVYLNKEKWGFNILPIYRDESAKVYRGDEVFISFETEQMMESFFDGKK
jgi:hypothetical protein